MFVMLFFGQLGAFAIWATAAWYLDAYGRRPLPCGDFDAIIVPGCAVRWDGLPSGALARRTRHGIALFKSGRAKRLVFTGGVGTHPPAEAEVAAEMARQAGVDPASIFVETQSSTTAQNAAWSAKVTHDAHLWSILVVSDGYHCWRCLKLFSRHFGAVATVGSSPPPRARIRGAMREVISILRMWIF